MRITKTINILFIPTVFALVTNSCNSDTRNYKLDYPKYYDIYTFNQLTDLLFADTLSVGLDIDSERTQRQWYTERINELINDLRDDWKKPDSLFPMKSFDKIKITQSPTVNR